MFNRKPLSGRCRKMVHLRRAIATVHRDDQSEHSFVWPHDPLGRYMAKSTYTQVSQGGIRFPTATGIWRSWVPLKCKIFAWLAVQHRLWISDRRARHGLQEDSSSCYICLQEEVKFEHILVQCVYARSLAHKFRHSTYQHPCSQ